MASSELSPVLVTEIFRCPMSALGHSLPICFGLASYNVCSAPKADIRFQRNIRRDGPGGDIHVVTSFDHLVSEH